MAQLEIYQSPPHDIPKQKAGVNAAMTSKITKLPLGQKKRKAGTESGRNFSVRPHHCCRN